MRCKETIVDYSFVKDNNELMVVQGQKCTYVADMVNMRILRECRPIHNVLALLPLPTPIAIELSEGRLDASDLQLTGVDCRIEHMMTVGGILGVIRSENEL